MRHIVKGLTFGLPISIVIWALLVSSLHALLSDHPHALVRVDKDVQLALGRHYRAYATHPSV